MLSVDTLALAKAYADELAISGGIKYMGSKPKASDLPAASSSNKGNMYTISGTDQPDYGHEYLSDGTEWVDLGADLNNKVDKPAEPIAGQGVNVPYYFDVTYSADKATVKDYTIDLLDKSKAPATYNLDINAATEVSAGLMTASDKAKLDDVKDIEANVAISGDWTELKNLKLDNVIYRNLTPFPTGDVSAHKGFKVNGTLQEFGQSIINYEGFTTGCVWYGGLQCTDLPGGMIQVECKVTAIRDTSDFTRNIAVVEIFSSEVAPFYWHYNTDSWEEGTGLDGWKYVASIDGSKFDSSATTTDEYNVKCKKVSAAAGSSGWEFYTEKPQVIAANPTLAGTEANLTGLQVGDTKYKIEASSGPSAYLSDANVTDNVLKIQNKLGQDIVTCDVNYTLDNAKVKAVLSDSEKNALISGITSDMVVNTVYLTGEQDISSTKNLASDAKLGFKPQDNTNINISAAADTYSDTLKLVSGNTTGTTVGNTELDIFYNYNTGRKIIMPATDGDVELGRTGNQLKNIFVSGYIKDGDTTGSHSISVAEMAAKSTVTASSTGTSTTEAKYLTIDGTEYKLSAAADSPIFYATWVPGGEATDFDTVKAAIDAGKFVIVKYYDSSHTSWHYCSFYCSYTCGTAVTDPGLTYFFRGATISDPEMWSPAPTDIFIAVFKSDAGITNWTRKS